MPNISNKRPTRDDLTNAIKAAQEAAGAASSAAQAAGAATETVLAVIEGLPDGNFGEFNDQMPQTTSGQPGFRQRGTRDWAGGNPAGMPTQPRTSTRDRQQQAQGGQGQGGQDGQGQGQTPTGPGAEATGHGMARGGGRRPGADEPEFWETFMQECQPAIGRGGNKLRVDENASFVKIESLKNGHKIYIAKGKTAVSRIESTLDPSMVEGAAPPDRKNGRIASWIPATSDAVMAAIDCLVQENDEIRPPERGGGDTMKDQERGFAPNNGGKAQQQGGNQQQGAPQRTNGSGTSQQSGGRQGGGQGNQR